MVILRTRNKITDFLMILAWASPFKNMLNNCTLSLFVIGGCDIYTYFCLLIFVTFIFQVIITEHNNIGKMYRVYLPICVHNYVHVIPSILIFTFVIGLPAIQTLFLI